MKCVTILTASIRVRRSRIELIKSHAPEAAAEPGIIGRLSAYGFESIIV